MQFELIITTAPNEDVLELVAELDDDLAGYAPEQHHGIDIASIFAPNLVFVVAYVEGMAAGCGGIAFFSKSAELKRMYVRNAYRGTELATKIIQFLENAATEKQIGKVQLETGDKQLAAIKIYGKNGYQICEAFAPYTELDLFSIETSIFMEKHL